MSSSLTRAALVCTSAMWALATALPLSGQTIGVDYSRLSPQQQGIFQRFSGCFSTSCPAAWQKLNSSEQLEFAGGTQALYTVHLNPTTVNGLEEVDNVTQPHGSESGQPSEKQFNVETNWKSGASDQFEHASGWSPHIALLHPGQFGFQQNQEGNPFLGLVALFDDSKPEVGQFHIDFRSWFAHYCSDNGNIAANYKRYIKWYGAIQGYSPIFQFVSPELTRDELSATATKSGDLTSQTETCSGDIGQTVQRFLTMWYVDRNLSGLLDFVAQDNVYNAASLENLNVSSPAALWVRLFSDAFEPSSGQIEKLEGALQYHQPSFRDHDIKLRYFNSATAESATAAYAIIDPESLPKGTLFPPSEAPKSERSNWDIQSRFLDHLRQTYQARLYVVIYLTAARGLVHETAIQYWVKEGACWRISAFQGTDW